jgi:hypothetical protein
VTYLALGRSESLTAAIHREKAQRQASQPPMHLWIRACLHDIRKLPSGIVLCTWTPRVHVAGSRQRHPILTAVEKVWVCD